MVSVEGCMLRAIEFEKLAGVQRKMGDHNGKDLSLARADFWLNQALKAEDSEMGDKP